MDHAQLFREYRDDVYRLAVCYTRSREDAEDVCQTVFLKLLERKFLDPGKEKQWLLRVTANECKNLLRSHWWKTTVPMDETISVEPPEVNDTLQAVLSLEEKYRLPIHLYYYEGYSLEEIAGLLRARPGTVGSWLSRGREKLKELLKEDYFET